MVGFGAGIWAVAVVLMLENTSVNDPRSLMVGVFALLTAGLLSEYFRGDLGHRALGILTLALVLSELTAVCCYLLPNRYEHNDKRYLRVMPQPADLVEFLRTRPQPLRVDAGGDDIPFNFGDFYGVEQMRGYLASVSSNLISLELHGERMQQVYSVGYFLGRDAARANQVKIFESRSGLKVFENPGALPRVRVVRHFVDFEGTVSSCDLHIRKT